jgi:hypothetical protein
MSLRQMRAYARHEPTPDVSLRQTWAYAMSAQQFSLRQTRAYARHEPTPDVSLRQT